MEGPFGPIRRVDLTAVSTVTSPPGVWRRRSTALLDGEFPWGAIISTPHRYGAAQQRLVVYPPGITKQDRRWLRLWRGFPQWGSGLWLVVYLSVPPSTGPWYAAMLASGVCAVGGSAAFVMAGDSRCAVRILNACAFTAAGDAELLAGQRRLRLLATALVTADGEHRRAELSTVDYEMIWWRVYEAMGPERG